jgi:hypothetical protein
VAVAPAAHAGLEPAGTCAYQSPVASGQLTLISSSGSGPTYSATYVAQLSVSVQPPLFVPSNTCVFDVSGTFLLFGSGPVAVTNPDPLSGTTTPCAPAGQSDYGIPGNGGCTSIGVVTLGNLQSAAVEFTGTVTAVNDGVSGPLSCQLEFTGGSAFVFCGDPGQVHTL